MLNFQHTIRKIKVDLICGREASETEFTEYLDNFDKNNIKEVLLFPAMKPIRDN